MLISLKLTDIETVPQGDGLNGLMGVQTHILAGPVRSHHWSGPGSLSIKFFTGGRAFYNVGCGTYAVDDDRYLILNHRQPYEIEYASRTPFDAFCLFFEEGFVEQVLRTNAAAAEHLLDDPLAPSAPVRFFERTWPHDTLLTPTLKRLKARLPELKEDAGALTEALHETARNLTAVHETVRSEIARLDSVRPATRAELYRRLHRARDFMRASFERPLTLIEVARIACLSPNHLLRTFKQAFRQTPHQYLTQVRLERAQALLLRTDLPVTEICLAVGFESLGSFSTLFRRHCGLSPDAYRRIGC